MENSNGFNKILRNSFLIAAVLIFFITLGFLIFAKPSAKPANNKNTVQDNYSDTNILIGAGDIANCGAAGAIATAKLLEQNQGVIFTAGDNAQRLASLDFYNSCFGESWGKYLPRIRPALGNHDYETPGAAGYFSYFGAAAGEAGQGYYGYNLGAWRVIVLNSNCAQVGGCGADSPQGQWLKNELAVNPALCTIAYWHQPYFNSGNHSSDEEVKPFWEILNQAGAEIVLNGHAHDYERFAPQTPDGVRDDLNGIREFVVGTGGYAANAFEKIMPNSEARSTGVFGVLKLELNSGEYKWQFIPVAGEKFTDSGSGKCH